jgi:hypothetical protein
MGTARTHGKEFLAASHEDNIFPIDLPLDHSAIRKLIHGNSRPEIWFVNSAHENRPSRDFAL